MTRIGIVPTGLYKQLGQPWWVGIVALFAAVTAGFFLVSDALLLLVGLVVPLAGGAVFGYRQRSFWWAVVAVVAAWIVFAVVRTVRDGWDVGPAQDVIAAVFLATFLAGATMLGGALGKGLASPPTSR